MPFALRLYLGLVPLLGPLAVLLIRWRVWRGLDDPRRWRERLGHSALPRPDGAVLWCHAASVGEAQALVTLLDRFLAAHPGVSVVLTTQTLASAEALAARDLPPGVIHQFAPLDTPSALRRFRDHWRPTALVVTEIDLWPGMLTRARRAGLGMVLLNTHLPPDRLRRRLRRARVNGYLFNLFDQVLVQDEDSRLGALQLGIHPEKLAVMGPLKAASDPLPDDAGARAALAAQIGARPVWLAASTWPGEEDAIFAAQVSALTRVPDLLLIIAPRQRALADQTEASARAHFPAEAIARRSHGAPITAQTRVYLADTLGEMGLWYRLAPLAFVGKSLPPDAASPKGGHNPFEPAALGAVVLHGPAVGNFTESYAALAAQKGALCVTGPESLADHLVALQDPARRAPLLAGAARVLAENRQPLEIAMAALNHLIDRRSPAP